MEIVTEPDITSGTQAASFVRQLIVLLKALGVSDGKLAGTLPRASIHLYQLELHRTTT
jgi:Asp-tRNA(Asn)/Glu-tRNA(Gln) amidotransferase B subunit